jgi:HEAT repeat protein
MNIPEIEIKLASHDISERLVAIKALALKKHKPEEAIPLLLKARHDEQFLVRSLAAMGLGKNQTAESFDVLLQMLKFDQDSHVRAEASNSLSLFGENSIPYLQEAFIQDDAWLVRLSILGALMEFNCPEVIFAVCDCGIKADNASVQEYSIDCLASLVETKKEEEALNLLLSMVDNPSWFIRLRVAKSLKTFSQNSAKDALSKLQNDDDERVVSAVLEPQS